MQPNNSHFTNQSNEFEALDNSSIDTVSEQISSNESQGLKLMENINLAADCIASVTTTN